ncbi:MAG: hypothetical protein K1X86_03110 [Ignavibacteria bacterium]|nr:hypothetical protein [Ignavibacteria bacterium]
MKKSSDDLYLLIKSLSKTERAYFKKFAKRFASAENFSLKLFEEIERQVEKNIEYDEELISVKLGKRENLNQLSVAKNYLYDLILRSLLAIRAEKSLDDKLDKYVINIELLMDKALFQQAWKILRKAKKISYSYENFSKLYSILQYEKNLLLEGIYDNVEQKLNDVFKEELNALQKLKKKSEIQNLGSRLSALILNNGYLQNKNEIRKAKEIMNHPHLKKLDESDTYTIKTFFYHLHTAYYNMTGDHIKYFNYTKQFLEMIEANPLQIARRATNYFFASHNMVSACTYAKKYDEFFYYLERFRSIPERYKILHTDYIKNLLFLSYKMELIMFYDTGQFENGITLAESIANKLQHYKPKIGNTETFQFYFYISCMYFGKGDYNNALNWINKILNAPEPDHRKDLYAHSKIYNLVIHYELGNREHLEYIVNNTFKFWKDRNRITKFESAVFKHFKNLKNSVTKNEVKDSFGEFLYELQKLYKSTEERHSFNFFDYISWAKSKVSGKSFTEVKMENFLPNKK